MTQPHYSPDLVPCNFWFFPKLKSPLKGKRFQTILRIRKIWQGTWWLLGELCEIPGCLLWRGLRHHCPVYNIYCIFFKKCLYFSYYMAGYLQDRPCTWRVLCLHSFSLQPLFSLLWYCVSPVYKLLWLSEIDILWSCSSDESLKFGGSKCRVQIICSSGKTGKWEVPFQLYDSVENRTWGHV